MQGQKQRRDQQNNAKESLWAAAKFFYQETLDLYNETALDRLENTKTTKLPPITEGVWRQPMETSLNHRKLDKIIIAFAIETTQKTQRLEKVQLCVVTSRTLLTKGCQLQKPGTAKEQFRGNQIRNGLVPFLNSSSSCQTDIQEKDRHLMTTLHGDNKVRPLTKITQTSTTFR